MASGKLNILVEQGATLDITFYLKDPSGNPLNLSNCHAAFQSRPDPFSSVVLLDLNDQGKGGVTLGGAAGTIQVVASATQTSAIPVDQLNQEMKTLEVGIDTLGNKIFATGFAAPYAIERTDSYGRVFRDVEGYLVLSPEVVR